MYLYSLAQVEEEADGEGFEALFPINLRKEVCYHRTFGTFVKYASAGVL